MGSKKSVLGLFAEAMDVPRGILPGMSVMEIVGNQQIIIENHCGITEYTGNTIGVRLKWGNLLVSGKNLQITRMEKCQMVITGVLDGLEIRQGGGK